MRLVLLGATGALGRSLVPRLLEAGHDVAALARSPEKQRVLRAMGAESFLANPLDKQSLIRAVTDAKPTVIVHQLTALSQARGNFKKLDDEFALTNRFRTEVTDTLLEAARRVGATQFVAQSFCGWPFARVGGSVKTEDDPLDPNPPGSFRKTLAAIRYLETRVTEATDIQACALRYGIFYGPGTGISRDGSLIELIRKRRFPIVGSGTGVWSFVHIDDAARATVAAIAAGVTGIYNIVDDEPAPVAAWLPYLAQVVKAKRPLRIPGWLAKPLIGEGGVSMMTQVRAGSNAKAKRGLQWKPQYESWRHGFADGLS